jgi:Cu/Zn superoxide dismutase
LLRQALLMPSSGGALARAAAVVLLLAAGLTSCDATKTIMESRAPGLGGKIVPLGGSAAKGFIVIKRRTDGVTLIVNLNDVRPGIYRVVFHATGNCKSPNGFSAGPPWAPPGREIEAYNGAMNADGLLNMSIPISGIPVDPPDGIYGRSVVVHQGISGSLDTEPGVRNNRIACVVLNEASEFLF